MPSKPTVEESFSRAPDPWTTACRAWAMTLAPTTGLCATAGEPAGESKATSALPWARTCARSPNTPPSPPSKNTVVVDRVPHPNILHTIVFGLKHFLNQKKQLISTKRCLFWLLRLEAGIVAKESADFHGVDSLHGALFSLGEGLARLTVVFEGLAVHGGLVGCQRSLVAALDSKALESGVGENRNQECSKRGCKAIKIRGREKDREEC